MKSLFQGQIDFVLDIPSASRPGRGAAATASATPTRLAKDIVEEFGIRRFAPEEVFQVFGTGVLDVHPSTRLGRPGLSVEILIATAARLLPLPVLSPQLIILLALFRVR